MPTKVEVTLFKFNELSDDAKENAIERFRDINIDHEWYDFTIEAAKQIGETLGIEIENVYFSGFYSQGDGACFEGSYTYNKDWKANLTDHVGGDDLQALIKIGEALEAAQKDARYSLEATMKHDGHHYYYNSGCMDVHIEADSDKWIPVEHLMGEEAAFKLMEDAVENNHDHLKDTLRSFADWIYRNLEKEYEYLTSDEAVIESIEANEYDFDEDGELWGHCHGM